MKFVILVNKACEKLAIDEVKYIVGKRPVKRKNSFEFSTNEALDACKLCYFSRSINKVFLQVTKKQAEKYDENVVKKFDKKFYILFSAQRNYIIKNNPPNLNMCIAFLAVKEAKLKKTDIILDPLCRGGKFLIEASQLLNNVPVGRFMNFAFTDFKIFAGIDFNKLFKRWDKGKDLKLKIYGIDSYTGNIDNAKENLRAAKVKAKLSCRSIDWMDSLFKKGSIDKIITMLPSGKHKSTEALYRELFYQADYCLNKKSLMVIVSEQPDFIKKYAEQMNFKILDTVELDRMKLFKLKPLA